MGPCMSAPRNGPLFALRRKSLLPFCSLYILYFFFSHRIMIYFIINSKKSRAAVLCRLLSPGWSLRPEHLLSNWSVNTKHRSSVVNSAHRNKWHRAMSDVRLTRHSKVQRSNQPPHHKLSIHQRGFAKFGGKPTLRPDRGPCLWKFLTNFS